MILTLGIVVCVGVIGFSGYKLISTGLAYKEGEDEYSSLRKYTMEVAEAEVPQEDKSEAEGSSEQAQEDTRTPVEGVKTGTGAGACGSASAGGFRLSGSNQSGYSRMDLY